jgi:hypothetical protein
MALTTNHSLNETVAHGYSSSLGATPIVAYTRAPYRGIITEVGVIQNGAVTGTSTVTTAVNGAAISGGALAVTAGSAGTLFNAQPTAVTPVNEGDVISFTPAGATGSVTGYCYAVVRKQA